MTVDEAMSFAIELAKQGAPFVSPNPLVGCVILSAQQELIGHGYHQKYGEAHAEINALKGLTESQLKGAHVVVTLEPCAHQGKTGSCAKKLIEYPIARVTYGLQDPFPLVAGKGAQIIRAAGIACVNYSAQENTQADPQIKKNLELVCEVFLKNVRQSSLFCAIKLAQSLDGKMGLPNGKSKWITSEASRRQAHYLRGIYDVLAVGYQTILIDDPALDIRGQSFQKQNQILILDPAGKTIGQNLKVFSSHAAENIFWAVDVAATLPASAPSTQVLRIKTLSRGFDLNDLFQQLWQRSFRSLLVEGGPRTISSFLEMGLVDRLHLFQAPLILGSSAAGWAEGLHPTQVQDGLPVEVDHSTSFGPDFYFSGRFKSFVDSN